MAVAQGVFQLPDSITEKGNFLMELCGGRENKSR